MVKSGGADYESKSEGDMFSVPPRTPMTVKNVTDKPAQLYSVLVVDEHEPFVYYWTSGMTALKIRCVDCRELDGFLDLVR